MTSDPYSTYLSQADALFNQGEMVKAGQIWQAILKQQPAHAEARQRLLDLKQHLLALREREVATPLPPRNLRKMGQLCPAMAARAARTCATC